MSHMEVPCNLWCSFHNDSENFRSLCSQVAFACMLSLIDGNMIGAEIEV